LDRHASCVRVAEHQAVHAAQDVDPDRRGSEEKKLIGAEPAKCIDDVARSAEPCQRAGDGIQVLFLRPDEDV